MNGKSLLFSDHERMNELLRIRDEAPVVMEPSKSALIVVDVQRWFTRLEYPLWQLVDQLVSGAATGYLERVQSRVLSNIRRLQQTFRSRGLPVIFLATGSNLADGRDLPVWMRDFDLLSLKLLGKRVVPPRSTIQAGRSTTW